MPRDDIHNADDLANVIQREVIPNQTKPIIVTGMKPSEVVIDRNILPLMTTLNAAIRGTIGPDAETDLNILSQTTFQRRLSNPINRLQETARFNRR